MLRHSTLLYSSVKCIFQIINLTLRKWLITGYKAATEFRSRQKGSFAWPPIEMSENFLVHVSGESSSNISPNPSEVISKVSKPSTTEFFPGMESFYFCELEAYAKFRNPTTIFENTPPCPPKYVMVRGVPEFVFWLESFYFYTARSAGQKGCVNMLLLRGG